MARARRADSATAAGAREGTVRRMQRRVTAFGLALAVVAAIALGASAAVASNAQTFTDSTGEDPAAPDITSVAVSNDDTGLVTFQVNVANRPALTPDMLFLVFVDSIPGEGDSESFGADYDAFCAGVPRWIPRATPWKRT